jgi:hypothetical protein
MKKGLILFAVVVTAVGMAGTLKAGPNFQLPPYSPQPATFGPVPAAPPSTPGASAFGGGNQYGASVGVNVPVGNGAVNGSVTVTGNGQIVGGQVGATVPLGH